jgi:hypothetical protein
MVRWESASLILILQIDCRIIEALADAHACRISLFGLMLPPTSTFHTVKLSNPQIIVLENLWLVRYNEG